MKREKAEETSISYLLKRLTRSWKVFLALLLSIALASTFFAGVNVGADTVAKQYLDRQLSQVPVDIRVSLNSPLSAANFTTIVDEINNSNVEGIAHVEVISRLDGFALLPNSNETYSKQVDFRIIGISEYSRVYEGLTVMNGSSSVGVNETYVWVGSESFEYLKLGDTLQFNLTIGWIYEGMGRPKLKTLTLNLTVVGFVDLEEQALGIARGYYYYLSYQVGDNILIVDWNKTFTEIIDVYYEEDQRLNTEILIFLDRESVINMWDIDGSIERLRTITFRINNIVAASGSAYSGLESTLNSYRWISQSMRLAFIVTSLPVFFIAWYMGTTVSDVSYNLRRREIGLLLTKGFSRRQLLRMFLSEAVLIGLIGGLIGVGLSFLLTPFFIQGVGFFTVRPIIGIDTIIITFLFSAGLTLLSVFQPARRASKLDIVDALQEYRYVEEVKPYKSKWPWIAFILGLYKIVMWLLGINLSMLMMIGGVPIYNILIIILLLSWLSVDSLLNYVGPILFFWGFTKIFIRGSLKFQEFIAKLVKFAGDLGVLSTKNVRRNPARTAAIAFLTAMIIGYGFQVIGSYASEQDYVIRQVRFNVGADISVQMSTLQNLSLTMDKVRNVSGVSSITVEYRFYATVAGRSMSFIVVNPEEWLNVAYCENILFTGRDVASAFQEMKNNNNTIILERGIAEMLKLSLDGNIAVTFGSKVFNLKVVGFFGSEQTQLQQGNYWSYIPEGLYHLIENETSFSSGKILVKLLPGANGEAVAEDIRNLRLSDVSVVYSVEEILKQWQENPFGSVISGTPIFGVTGSTEIQRLGVAFAVLAASLGVALVTFVSLKERSKEVGIMSVRGLSFKQITGVLLIENLAVLGFAVFLGAVVGLIVIHGNISALNSVPMPTVGPIYGFSPIQRRIVFPLDSTLTLASCCVLVFASTVIPVIIMARRYVSELERIVRGT